MSVMQTVRKRLSLARANPALSFSDWLGYFGSFNYGGMGYPFMTGSMTLGQKQEVPQQSFEGYIQQIYKTNGVIFACMLARMTLFSQARFQFRRRVKGRPGELFGTAALQPLETPWTNATTGDLLARVIQDADLAGNAYCRRRGPAIHRLRPDWMTIVVGSQSSPDDPGWAMDAEVLGYIHQPGGPASKSQPEILLPSEIAHYAPIPDPMFRFRGMSWITPVVREVMGDAAATTHKLKFFENGATPNLVVSLDKSILKEQYDAFVTKMKEQHEGVLNAYRTLYLGGGSTATVVGANMRQIDFKLTQGAGETRIAAAAGVPPIIVGLSEGLGAATYSNYAQARRAFSDGTMAYLWQNMAGSFQHLIDTPAGAELWYDDRDIPFLREDEKDRAAIAFVEAQTFRQLVDAGYKPESVKEAIISGDWERLVHSGLYSVQLQSPGTTKLPELVPGETIAKPIVDGVLPPQLGDGKKLPALGDGKTPPPPAAPPKRDRLTHRQEEIEQRLDSGLTHKEIAAELDISVRTVAREAAKVRQWQEMAA